MTESLDTITPQTPRDPPESLQQLADRLCGQSQALCANLQTSDAPPQDDALRGAIAEIAAGMIVLTASQEGSASPIPALLAKASPQDGPAQPLLDRVQALAPDLLKR